MVEVVPYPKVEVPQSEVATQGQGMDTSEPAADFPALKDNRDKIPSSKRPLSHIENPIFEALMPAPVPVIFTTKDGKIKTPK